MLALEDEEVEIPSATELVPLDASAFTFDFDIDWAGDSFVSANAVGS
jgi:hypothetical protein